jgi:WD40 repeat protein
MPESEASARRWLRLPRFSLRALLIAITLLSIVFAVLGTYWFHQYLERKAIAGLRDGGAKVLLDKTESATRVWLGGPTWDDNRLIDAVPSLLRLRRLKELDIVEAPITDVGLKQLERVRHIKLLYLHEIGATESAIQDLAKALPGVEIRRERPDPIATKLAARKIFRSAVIAAASSPDGVWIVTGSGDGTLRWWSNDSDLPAETTAAHDNWLFATAFSADGKLLATGGGDNHIKLWNTATRKHLVTLDGHTDDVHSLTFDPRGRFLYSAGDDRVIRVWDVARQQQVDVLEGHEAAIPSIAISPDGHTLVSGSRDDTVRLWDVSANSRPQLHLLKGHHADVSNVTFSPDGSRIASAGYDRMVRVWSIADGKEERKFAGHTDWVFAVAFFPDGQQIASGAGDGTLRVWDVLTGRQLESYTGQTNIACIRFGSLGRSLISTAADGSVRVRDVASGSVERLLGTRFGDRELAFTDR